ncbi:hypothetical protein Tco_0858856 [Tanacetum coccineum]|uniref:Uncharacterized protein n=1 Tax=Tanacetum coccineum TaxID=301880 RepID=A0ABQ5BG08_9ASTR
MDVRPIHGKEEGKSKSVCKLGKQWEEMKSTLDIERLRQIHTPPDDAYDILATDSILDKLVQELGDDLLDITIVNEEADCNPTKDIEELERLLVKDP